MNERVNHLIQFSQLLYQGGIIPNSVYRGGADESNFSGSIDRRKGMEVACPGPRSWPPGEAKTPLAPPVSFPAARATELPASPAPAGKVLLPKPQVWRPPHIFSRVLPSSHRATRGRVKVSALLVGNGEHLALPACATRHKLHQVRGCWPRLRAGQSLANTFPSGAKTGNTKNM